MKKYLMVALALGVLAALVTLSVICTLGCDGDSTTAERPPTRAVETPSLTVPMVTAPASEPAPVVEQTAPRPAPAPEPAPAPAPEPQPQPEPTPEPAPAPPPVTAPCPT